MLLVVLRRIVARVTMITIRVRELDPPSGWVSRAEEPEVEFAGWLGLLRVLSEMLEAQT